MFPEVLLSSVLFWLLGITIFANFWLFKNVPIPFPNLFYDTTRNIRGQRISLCYTLFYLKFLDFFINFYIVCFWVYIGLIYNLDSILTISTIILFARFGDMAQKCLMYFSLNRSWQFNPWSNRWSRRSIVISVRKNKNIAFLPYSQKWTCEF